MLPSAPRSTLFPYTTLFRSIEHPINDLLPPTIRYGDGDAQPEQYSNDNLEWTEPESSPREIGQRLAKQLTRGPVIDPDRKSTRLNSSHTVISYAVFCLKTKT